MAQTYYVIKGDTMIDGYISDFDSKTLPVTVLDGAVYEYDVAERCVFAWEVPLVVDAAGFIVRPEAASGCGFLPDDGEMERLAKRGVVIPALVL